MLTRRVYQAGSVASQCTSGRDSTFSNLCSLNENINVNDWRSVRGRQVETPGVKVENF